MDPERRDRLKQIYFAALDLSSTAELEAYLATACPADPELAEEVRTLLAADRAAGDTFLERPAARVLGLTTAADSGPAAVGSHAPVTDWERYTDLELIASGGMGDVYRAFDPRLKRHTALKFIRGASAKHVERFLREAEAQARVEHANVLEVYETGEVNGQLYIAMRFIAGPTLKETREETTVEQKVVIMRQVAEAIHAAHREGLVHRDVKPTNILIERTADGILKPWVTDFGIVADDRSPALTATGDLVGTPWYMAPERLTGDEATVDRRSDVFSLGVTLYEYLSGERPYQANNAVELFSLVREGPPRRLRQVAPELPQDLETIVMKCLEHEPDRRYQSARDLADDLGRFLDGETISARRPSLAYAAWVWVRRNRALTGVSATAVLLLATLAVVDLVNRRLEREFNHRVEEIENLMRLARGAPTHDLASESALVDDAVAAILERMRATRPLGEGAGLYALGRAYLATDRFERAHEYLQRAQAKGHDGPAVAAALGQVQARLYFESTQAAEREADKDKRQQALARADAEFRKPALANLRNAGEIDGTNTEVVEALIAFLEGHTERALERASQASTTFRWLYEAHRLEGDIRTQVGYTQRSHGDDVAARASWQEALAAYQEAAAVARSDRDSHVGVCRVGELLMELEVDHSREAAEHYFAVALEACRNARVVDPDRADASRLTFAQAEVLRLMSDLHCQRARSALRFGGDARASVEEAVRAATRVLAKNADDGGALLARGNAYLAEARIERRLGSDAREAYTEAVDAYDRVLQHNPRSLDALQHKGHALVELAELAAAAGDDASALLEEAVDAQRRAREVASDDVRVLADLGLALAALAELELARGADPGARLDEASELFERALAGNQSFAEALAGRGLCQLLRAQLSAATGGGLQPYLAAASADLTAATELDPGLAAAWSGRARVQAMAAAAADGSSRADLARIGLEAAGRALDLDPGLAAAHRARSELERIVSAGREAGR